MEPAFKGHLLCLPFKGQHFFWSCPGNPNQDVTRGKSIHLSQQKNLVINLDMLTSLLFRDQKQFISRPRPLKPTSSMAPMLSANPILPSLSNLHINLQHTGTPLVSNWGDICYPLQTFVHSTPQILSCRRWFPEFRIQFLSPHPTFMSSKLPVSLHRLADLHAAQVGCFETGGHIPSPAVPGFVAEESCSCIKVSSSF